ncbi:hypothetical protein ACS3UN_04425 [Oscillospiraceae bacterium LTW-04]|nr:hypothetical protein RBH76_06040 [Oscillospiraceae bacterium MB24-C1]
MRQHLKTAIKVTLFIIIGIWILDKIPFNQNINHEISVNIYNNGTVIDETTVLINGEKSNYLFTQEERFWGKFQILAYEESTRENMNVSIKWNNEDNMQSILYMLPGDFPDMDVMRIILINDQMTKFALMFEDGTIVATSNDLYQLYIKHISINKTGGMSVKDVNGIPKIDN